MWRSRRLSAAGLRAAENLAHSLHKGSNIYHDKTSSVRVLEEIARAGPEWWCSECDEFLADLREAPNFPTDHFQKCPDHHLTLVVEGLDGVGKSTTTQGLAKKLGGKLMRTPSSKYELLRKKFRHLPEGLARAWYCGANYLAAVEIEAVCREQPAVIDRWWYSTCAMAIAGNCDHAPLPHESDVVYRWPGDLPQPDGSFLLTVDESIRLQRMKTRGDEKPAEALLARNQRMREFANKAYIRMGLLEIDTPTYMVAVNTILEVLEKSDSGTTKAKFKRTQAVPFTADEMKTVKPY